MRTLAFAAALLAAMPLAALAQPGTDNERPVVRSALPAPDLPENAKVSDFLHAALGAVASGRAGQAEEALEMAQTRLLDRSVPLGRTHELSADPAVGQIAQARQALGAGDRVACLQAIQAAIRSTTAEGL
nr:hypothetical protein [uncultured Rhodopila sp.]